MTDPRDGAVARPGTSGIGAESRLADRTLAGRVERTQDAHALNETLGDERFNEPGDEAVDHDATLVSGAKPYRGAVVRADRLELPEIANPQEIVGLSRPSLIVVGGTRARARQLADHVVMARGGVVREFWADDASAGDFAAALTMLDGEDVLFISSLDNASAVVVDILAGVLIYNALDVQIGKGPSARSLRLELKPAFILARSISGKVPDPLDGWGGLMVLQWETKLCPRCAEEVKTQALVCRYCGHEFAKSP